MRRFQLLFFLFLFVSFCHGSWVLWQYDHQHWPAQNYNHPVNLTGTIVSLPQPKSHALQFNFQTQAGLLQLKWYQPFPPKIEPGDVWQLPVKIKPYQFEYNPGEFNYGHYLRMHGIIASGYVLNHLGPKLLKHQSWKTPIQLVRTIVYHRIIHATNHLKMQGVLIALILGDQSLLNHEQKQVFETSGTSYFMVISGLHIVLLAMLVGLLARYLWCFIPNAPLQIPAQKVGLAAGLVAGLIYSLLAGFLVPTQRALWMLWLMGLAKLLYQNLSTMQILWGAFIIVILWNPFDLFSVSFWLSFIAVFFLIYTLSQRLHKPNFISGWLYPQWVMYVALMPILIFVFHTFSLISLVTNFIAIPVMLLAVIPLTLLGGLVTLIYAPFGHDIFIVSNMVMMWLFNLLAWLTHLPHTILYLPQPHSFEVGLGLLGCLILFSPRGIPLRLSGAFMLLPLIFPHNQLSPNQIKVTHFHLAEGQATIFETAHSVIISQTMTHLRTAESSTYHTLHAYLEMRGIQHINLWILNGAKTYHNLNTVEAGFKGTPIQSIMTPSPFKVFDSRIQTCTRPKHIQLGKRTFIIRLNHQVCSIESIM